MLGFKNTLFTLALATSVAVIGCAKPGAIGPASDINANDPSATSTTPKNSMGGGSSVGGGHVRVCMTAEAAEKLKNTLVKNSAVDQIAMDPFGDILGSEIVSVETLDLLEKPGQKKLVRALLKDVAGKIEAGTKKWGYTELPRPIRVMKVSLAEIYDRLAATKQSAFNGSKEDRFSQALMDVWDNIEWSPSETGLRLTKDFDPKVTNAKNCIFAQAVRQTLFSERVAALDYDAKLLARMSDEDLIALALHESVYNLVLHAPKYRKLKNPSVTTREITTLLLEGLAGGGYSTSPYEDFAKILKAIGYGPYLDMDRVAYAKWVKENPGKTLPKSDPTNAEP